jgi:hypothetical protein
MFSNENGADPLLQEKGVLVSVTGTDIQRNIQRKKKWRSFVFYTDQVSAESEPTSATSNVEEASM